MVCLGISAITLKCSIDSFHMWKQFESRHAFIPVLISDCSIPSPTWGDSFHWPEWTRHTVRSLVVQPGTWFECFWESMLNSKIGFGSCHLFVSARTVIEEDSRYYKSSWFFLKDRGCCYYSWYWRSIYSVMLKLYTECPVLSYMGKSFLYLSHVLNLLNHSVYSLRQITAVLLQLVNHRIMKEWSHCWNKFWINRILATFIIVCGKKSKNS